MAISFAFGLHRLEQLGGEIGPRGLQHRVTLGREFGANDAEQLGRKLAPRIEQAVTAGFEHALEPAVARQQRALAVLHRHTQHQHMPVTAIMARLHHWLSGTTPESGFQFGGYRGRGRRFLKARRAVV